MSEHITPIRTYLLVFFALMILTAITVGVAFIDLGSALINDIVALVIAVSKATLVVLFFMHVLHSRLMTKITVVSSTFWLLILFGLTLSDYITRGFF